MTSKGLEMTTNAFNIRPIKNNFNNFVNVPFVCPLKVNAYKERFGLKYPLFQDVLQPLQDETRLSKITLPPHRQSGPSRCQSGASYDTVALGTDQPLRDRLGTNPKDGGGGPVKAPPLTVLYDGKKIYKLTLFKLKN